jgi:hypothetical protein
MSAGGGKVKKRDYREEAIQREMQVCVHFRGMQHDACKAGVRFDTFNQPDGRKPIPCLEMYDKCITSCDLRKFPTREEAEAHEREVEQMFAQVNQARKAAVEHAGGKRGVRGSLPCPVCTTGTLHYSIAGINGHVHGRCTTEGCVLWME